MRVCSAITKVIYKAFANRKQSEMSDSDSDLNASYYDPEDNLNIYGSPIYEEQPEDSDVVDEQSAPSTVVVDRPNRRSQVS